MDDLLSQVNVPKVYVHQLELFDGCEPIEEGFKYTNSSLSIETHHTHGHSVGGLTYVIDGLSLPVAVVGDAIFAGSMGGGWFLTRMPYGLITKIMSLPDNSILCPGHGPLTMLLRKSE